MDDEQIGKLTERQRECLRLVGQGLQLKEIAIRLETTPAAIKERLRLARQHLNASSSREAGRLLIDWESRHPYPSTGDPYPWSVEGQLELEPGPESGARLGSTDEVRVGTQAASSVGVHDRKTIYAVDIPSRRRTFWTILFPPIEERPNDLSTRARIGMIASIAALIALAIGTLLLVAMGISGYLTWLSRNGG